MSTEVRPPRQRQLARLFGPLLLVVVASSSAWSQVPFASEPQLRQALRLEQVEVQDLLLPEAAGGLVQATIRLAGLDYWFTLQPHSLRSDAFEVLVDTGGGLDPVALSPSKTFRGEVRGAQAGQIAGHLEGGQLTATLLLEDGAVWTIQPLLPIVPGAASTQHAVFQSEDVLPGAESCGSETLPPGLGSVDLGADGPSTEAAATGNQICQVAFDADYEFYQMNGSSVSATVDDIEMIMNAVDLIYERDAQIVYEITTVIVRSSASDPYTSSNSSTLLGEFVTTWQANHSAIQRDTAHLMTGKDIDGGVIGVAYVGVICSGSWAYGLSESRFSANLDLRVGLTAHELGHNWSSGHCDGDVDCHIMCSYINSCAGIGLPDFNSNSIASILSHKASRSCLTAEHDPISLANGPFEDDFDSASLSAERWRHVDSALVSTAALAEPTGSFTLNLDSAGSDQGEQDEVRTVEMLLSGEADVSVGFFSQHRGTENGESLYCEYLDSSGAWATLVQVTSSGVDQTEFLYHRAALPGNAYHDGFRLRLRSDSDESNDDWYIDSLRVFRTPTLTLTSPLTLGANGQVDIDDLSPGQTALLFFSFDGIGSGPCFVQGTQCIDLVGTIYVLASGVADGNGTLAIQSYIHPAIPSGLTFYLQAFGIGDVGLESDLTNTLTATTQN